MSREFSKEDIIQNKKEAIREVNKLLENYINAPEGRYLKKANLISFWLKSYTQMIRFEESFRPEKNIAYKRGNVVKINFGFNIGSEYGGLHYGIVLDNKNDHRSPVVTIIPLTSAKSDAKVHHNSVFLGNELYKTLKLKYDTVSKALQTEGKDISEMQEALSCLMAAAKTPADKGGEAPCLSEQPHTSQFQAIQRLENVLAEKKRHNSEQQEYLRKIGDEITNMKEGSIALVNLITTVSKIRIFDPRNLKGVLAGVSLSAESMEKLNQKVMELYVFKK